MNQIIIRPIITEKSLSETSQGRYAFEVHLKANKPQIAESLKNSFKVDPVSVQTMIIKGKRRRVGRTRGTIKLANWKKAIVQLKENQKIEMFEGGGHGA